MADHPTLRAERVTLRGLSIDDAQPLFALASDPAVTRHLHWPSPSHVDETEGYLRQALAEETAEPPTHCHFCITLTECGTPIGITSLTEINWQHRHAGVGSWIGQDHWGKGLMREAKALFLHHAFDTLELERVSAMIDIDNQRSLSSLESCCFRREGHARRAFHRDGRFVDALLLAILRGEHRPLLKSALEMELPL